MALSGLFFRGSLSAERLIYSRTVVLCPLNSEPFSLLMTRAPEFSGETQTKPCCSDALDSAFCAEKITISSIDIGTAELFMKPAISSLFVSRGMFLIKIIIYLKNQWG